MSDEESKVDNSGPLMLAGFGLAWTLLTTCIFGLIGLASLGLIGPENQAGKEPNLAMVGVMLAMFSPGPALLYFGGSELMALHASKAMRQEFPGKPWKWNADWTAGVIQANAASEAFWTWYFACALALFLVPGFLQLVVIEPDWRALVLVPFLVIDGLLFRFAWRRSRSARRYGKLALRLSQLPLVLGEGFDLLLEIPTSLEGQATLRLTCSVTVTTGYGDNKKSYSKYVYENSTQVPIVVSGQRSIIRGHLQLPESADGSDWALEITAAELDETFVLPVYEVNAPPDVETFSIGS